MRSKHITNKRLTRPLGQLAMRSRARRRVAGERHAPMRVAADGFALGRQEAGRNVDAARAAGSAEQALGAQAEPGLPERRRVVGEASCVTDDGRRSWINIEGAGASMRRLMK